MNGYFESVSSDLDPFKKILLKIPGFKGYIERQSRRDADKLLRTTLSDRFKELTRDVSDLQRQLMKRGMLDTIDDLESAVVNLQTFSDRIRTAARGYSGFFDAIKINETQLSQLYEYDSKMFDLVEKIEICTRAVLFSMDTESVDIPIAELSAAARDCLDILDRRSECILLNNAGEK